MISRTTKMKPQTLYLLIVLIVPLVTASSNKSSAKHILDSINEQIDKFVIGTQRDIVLVLGITGTGKSTITSLLTNVKLTAISEDDTYLIVDEADIIGKEWSTASKTSVPNLMIDEINGVAYYDCPGYSDTRGVEVNLATTFSIRKLLKFAESTKFLFVITYESARKGRDRRQLIETIQYATGLIKDLDKYRDAIALIVTKVDNNVKKKVLVDDETKIQAIARFLQLVKEDFQSGVNYFVDTDHNDSDRQIQLLDILLEKKGENYTRIGIMRQPDDEGSLSKNELIQSEKEHMTNIVTKNLRYARNGGDDFGYVIADKALAQFHHVIGELERSLVKEFTVLSSAFRKFVQKNEEEHSNSLKESIEMITKFNEKFAQISSTNPQIFTKQFTDTMNDLEVMLPVHNLTTFLKNIEFLDFIQVFNSTTLTVPGEISSLIDEHRTFFSDSKLWYSFLNVLHERLSAYPVQAKANTFDGSKILNLYIKIEDGDISIRQYNLESTFNAIDPHIFSAVQNVKINAFKVKLLQAVWMQTMQPSKSECSPDGKQLNVKGYNVMVADVIQSKCWSTVKGVEIFALHKVFFDADVAKPSMDLFVTAPNWEIVLNKGIENRLIKLNGLNGTEFDGPAADGSNESPGKIGRQGEWGGVGGNFFAIGGFCSGDNLEIDVSGGNGSSGQDGGNGVDSIKGTEAPDLKTAYNMEKNGYGKGENSKKSVGLGGFLETWLYRGKPATKATNGGDGGCKGEGARQGEFDLFWLNKQVKFTFHNHTGVDGRDGKGGVGGKGAADGRDLYLTRLTIYGEPSWVDESRYSDIVMKPDGKNGTDGRNCIPPKIEAKPNYNPLLTLNRYKVYVREHLATNVQVSDLAGFLDDLNGNDDINKQYDTFDFIDDFELLESHYFKLRKSFSFTPHYESLRDRIANYSFNLKDDADKVKAVNYLYTTVMSRLFAIKSDTNVVDVKNLIEYMKRVGNRMKRVQEIQKTVYINEYRDEYKTALVEKIETAGELIRNVITPQINGLFEETGNQIQELIKETVELGNKTEQALRKMKENRQTLKTKLVLHSLLLSVKMVGTAVSFLGPQGMIAGTAIGIVAGGAERVIDNSLQTKQVKLPKGLAQECVNRVANHAKNDFRLLKMQLEDLNKLVHLGSETAMEPIAIQLNLTLIEIEKVIKPDRIPSPIQIQDLQEAQQKLYDKIKELKGSLEESEEATKDNETIECLGRMKKVLRAGKVGLDGYEKIRNDLNQIDEVDEAIKGLEDQLKVIKQHERNIYNIMIPQFRLVEQSVNDAIERSKGKTDVELDVTKWMIRSTFGDVKKLFNEMSKEFSVEKDLERCVEKLNEGITTVIDIYDRIYSYTEKGKLADLIANSAIGSKGINDTELKTAIDKMEIVINGNLVMEQFQLAMQALKQHKFPFAAKYLGQFELPSNTSTNDIDFGTTAINGIIELEEKLEEAKHESQNSDNYLIPNFSFVQNNSFYKWKYDEYKLGFEKLLNGGNLTLVADVEDAPKRNAVKFNEAWIVFKMKNATVQREFDALLEHFYIHIDMVGNSFYRCGNRIYYISPDRNWPMYYSLKNGKTDSPNAHYSKLKNGDPFLSPYTTWTFSLRFKNYISGFQRLTKFKNDIVEISLEGRGEFLDNVDTVHYETCNDQLDKYYMLDHIESSKV